VILTFRYYIQDEDVEAVRAALSHVGEIISMSIEANAYASGACRPWIVRVRLSWQHASRRPGRPGNIVRDLVQTRGAPGRLLRVELARRTPLEALVHAADTSGVKTIDVLLDLGYAQVHQTSPGRQAMPRTLRARARAKRLSLDEALRRWREVDGASGR
jgi:hypothetical protein